MGRLFGTDGVRGLANEKLDCELAYKLGQAAAIVFTMAKHRPVILVGRDTRLSGDMLEAALSAGICSVGGEVRVLGVIPTPAVAFLSRHYGADAGVVISASHNSMEYNGIKIFNSQGYKLPDELEERIENIVLDGTETIPAPTGNDVGRIVRVKKAVNHYESFLKSTIDLSLEGFKVVVDCANGAASKIAPELLIDLGAEVTAIYNEPDGANINRLCGSTYPENLQENVMESGADLGFAFDGDADRLIAVDEHGQLVDGDQILAICGLNMKKRGVLKKDTVVSTVMSNLGLEKALNKAGCKAVKSDVGDRYVLERMLEEGYSLGGEQSGHIIFLDHNTTGDGILTALQIMAVIKRENKTLSELAKVMEKYPQVLVNARVSDENKRDYVQDPEIQKEIKAIENRFKGEGRVLIRPSGTEPLVRIMIEGKDQREIEEYAVRLAEMIEERSK
ncbi:MAG: phosphoglucosamine mutase [Clostridiales bacterium]|nr:phosphoglucosamine mutase [Clostridiales bacterium]